MISLIELLTISCVATLTAAGASQGLNRLRQSRRIPADTSTRPSCDSTSGRPAAGMWHEPRYGKRHRVSCQIEYRIEDQRYEGMLVDLSRQGWRVHGTKPVALGTVVKVSVFFTDIAGPLVVDEAIVRWTEAQDFGLELINLKPETAASLSEYLTTHFPDPENKPAYVFSPFSYN